MWNLIRLSLLSLVVANLGCETTKNTASYPSIVATRPLGSDCGPNDSATTTKRFPYRHPLGPSGGWSSDGTKVDYERTHESVVNEFRDTRFGIRGFVRFDVEGSLQTLVYDNVYGNVYPDCGWAPSKLKIQPTVKPVFVTLPHCFVGDGGVFIVSEICWFPKDSPHGKIVYSSGHSESSHLALNDIFEDSDIGDEYYFDDDTAFTVIRERLKKRELDGAQHLLMTSVRLVNSMKPSEELHEDGSVRLIPASEHHAQELSTLLMYELGFSFGKPEFDEVLKRFREHAVYADKKEHCVYCAAQYNLAKMYEWLHKAFLARRRGIELPVLPREEEIDQGSVGNDPKEFLAYLKGELSEEELLQYHDSNSKSFWLAMRHYLKGDTDGAKLRLTEALAKTDLRSEDDGFDLVVTARLLGDLVSSEKK